MKPFFIQRSQESWRNPWSDYRYLRDQHPVARITQTNGNEYVVLSRFNDVFNAARDTATFSSASGLTFEAGSMDMFDDRGRPIVMMDPPDHTVMRRLVSGPMSPSRIAEFEASVGEFVQERLNTLEDVSSEVDIVSLLLKPLPSYAVAHFLGVPTESRDRFDSWTQAIVEANAGNRIASSAEALGELYAFAEELIAFRRINPGHDLVSDLAVLDEKHVSTSWIIGFIFTMITGGNDTTTGMLAGSLELLSEYRDQRQVLLDDPSLIRRSVEEFLRLTSPVQNLVRQTTRPVTIEGVDIDQGQRVALLFGSANRDEREYGTDAEQLNVTRPLTRQLSFGYGAHHCLGAAVARSMGSITISTLLEQFPNFEVDPQRGEFAPGPYVRRYASLPLRTN